MFYSILKREWRGQTKKMNESILTSQQVKMAEEAEPHEILFAIHKRVVDTEKLMAGYRNHAKNLEIEIEMLKERVGKLEKIKDKEDDAWKAIYPIDDV